MTRYGMKESEMREIATLIRRVAIDMEDTRKVAKEVSEFRKDFTEVGYCFSSL
jgi:glycine hydroxymethyltransferase